VANVPVPVALRDELRLSDLVVWEAKRDKKGLPVFVTLAGPGIETKPVGWGETIEDAVDNALLSPFFLQTRTGLRAALARLEVELHRLNVDVWMQREKVTGVRDLDDDVPF
jgi:hypothetical protein